MRAMSVMLRVMVGRFSFTSFEMLSAVPARDRSMIGEDAVTSIDSVIDASCSLKSTVRSAPSATSTFSCFSDLKPLILATTVYGPGRTFRME